MARCPAATVSATNIDERTVLLTWTDSVCDIVYALQIETTTSMTLHGPPCVGDTLALDRRLLLQFAVPVDAAQVEVQLLAEPAPSASPAAELPGIATAEVPGGAIPDDGHAAGRPVGRHGDPGRDARRDRGRVMGDNPGADLVAYRIGATELGGGLDRVAHATCRRR